jgi:hypothetical protein
VVAKEKEVLAPSETAHASRLKDYREEKENVMERNESLRKEIDGMREKITETATTSLEMKNKISEVNMCSHLEDSRTAYALSLYAKISKITWKYKAGAGKIAGVIGDDTKSELKTFSIDTRQATSFDIANDLWNSIESASTH